MFIDPSLVCTISPFEKNDIESYSTLKHNNNRHQTRENCDRGADQSLNRVIETDEMLNACFLPRCRRMFSCNMNYCIHALTYTRLTHSLSIIREEVLIDSEIEHSAESERKRLTYRHHATKRLALVSIRYSSTC